MLADTSLKSGMGLSVTKEGLKSSSVKMFLLKGYIPVHLNHACILFWVKANGYAVATIDGISYIVIVRPG